MFSRSAKAPSSPKEKAAMSVPAPPPRTSTFANASLLSLLSTRSSLLGSAHSIAALLSSRRAKPPSLYTATSASTQWGPGALSGKAVHAMGKAVLRGAERLVIKRRMAVIRAHLPWSAADHDDDNEDGWFWEGIFDDLLELTRPELYADSIRIPAMAMVLVQVATSQTEYLVQCLSQWLLDDVILFMTELISVALYCKCDFLNPNLTSAYLSALPNGQNSLMPCITFLTELVLQNDTLYEAALLSGFLELILLSTAYQQKRPTLRQDATRAFTAMSAPPPGLEEVWEAALVQYYPEAPFPPPSLRQLTVHINRHAPGTWRTVEARFLERETDALLDRMVSMTFPLDAGRSVDDAIFPQLKDFTLSPFAGTNNMEDMLHWGQSSSEALWHLIRCVALGGSVLARIMDKIIKWTYRSKVSVLSRVLYLLLPDTVESRSLKMRHLQSHLGPDSCLRDVVTEQLLLPLAAAHPSLKKALYDAGITLVFPMLQEHGDATALFEEVYRRAHWSQAEPLSKRALKLIAVMRRGELDVATGEDSKNRAISALMQSILGRLSG